MSLSPLSRRAPQSNCHREKTKGASRSLLPAPYFARYHITPLDPTAETPHQISAQPDEPFINIRNPTDMIPLLKHLSPSPGPHMAPVAGYQWPKCSVQPRCAMFSCAYPFDFGCSHLTWSGCRFRSLVPARVTCTLPALSLMYLHME